MTIGNPIKDNNDKENYENDNSIKSTHSYSEPKSYAFNGKVVVGIGIIMAISAITTIFMTINSQSPQIHLSMNSLIPSFLTHSPT